MCLCPADDDAVEFSSDGWGLGHLAAVEESLGMVAWGCLWLNSALHSGMMTVMQQLAVLWLGWRGVLTEESVEWRQHSSLSCAEGR